MFLILWPRHHQGPTGRFFYIRRVCVGYWKKVELRAGSSSVEIFNLVPGFPIYAWEYPGILGISGWCPRIPSRACQPIIKIARSLQKCVFCDKYKISWFDGLPFRINTTYMVGPFPNIGYLWERINKGGKVGIFDLGACEVARSLQARLVGSHGF